MDINKLKNPKILFYDLETDSLEIATAKIKFFGALDFNTGEYIIRKWNDETRVFVQKLLKSYDFLIGFNNENYDNPILVNNGINTTYMRFIDVYHCFKNRKTVIFKSEPASMSMKSLVKILGINDEGKGAIDYKIFQKDDFTVEELDEIYKYLKQDLLLTQKLWEFLLEKFEPFKEFVSEENQLRFKYIKSTLGAYAYAMCCKYLGLAEEYGGDSQEPYTGAYVQQPTKETIRGKVALFDFGCIPENEYIYTYNGYKKIQNIKIYKDKSKSIDNKYNIINKITKLKTNKIIQIELSSGEILKVTPTHKLPFLDYNVINNKQAKDFKKGEKLIKPVSTPIQNGKYNEIFELLGIFVCEGTLWRDKRFIIDNQHPNGRFCTISQTSLTIKLHEKDFKKRIDYLLEKYLPYKIKWKKKQITDGKDYYNINIYDTRKEVYNWFNNLTEKYFNIEEITKNRGRVRAFLSGVLKSDACFNIKRKTLELGTTDEKVALLLRRCFEIVGVYYNCNKIEKLSTLAKKKTYRFEVFHKKELEKLFSWFKFESYRDNKIKFIHDNPQKQNLLPYRAVTIRNITILKEKSDVYDLSMERQESPYFIYSGIYSHNSLYPMMYVHANLFSSDCKCCSQEEKWHGNEMFKVNGYYCKKQQGQIETMIKEMFLKRKEMKKNKDEREKVYKYFLNSLYGISSRATFKHLYRPNLSGDCCLLAQSCIKFAIKIFTENGFNCVYTDTDSVFVELPENKTVDDAKELAVNISKILSLSFPFPWSEQFELKFEDELKYLQFFYKDDKIELKKKNYIYISNDNKMVVKGLDILQKDCSTVSKMVFNDTVKPQILEKLDCKFPKKTIDNAIKEILLNNVELLAKRFNIKDEDYKADTSIYSMIQSKYGTGEVLLIKNKKLGAGKSVKYCSIEEARELKFQDMELDVVYSELSPFIIEDVNCQNKKLTEFL